MAHHFYDCCIFKIIWLVLIELSLTRFQYTSDFVLKLYKTRACIKNNYRVYVINTFYFIANDFNSKDNVLIVSTILFEVHILCLTTKSFIFVTQLIINQYMLLLTTILISTSLKLRRWNLIYCSSWKQYCQTLRYCHLYVSSSSSSFLVVNSPKWQ